jgi:hypothetical protein
MTGIPTQLTRKWRLSGDYRAQLGFDCACEARKLLIMREARKSGYRLLDKLPAREAGLWLRMRAARF